MVHGEQEFVEPLLRYVWKKLYVAELWHIFGAIEMS